MPTDAVNLLAKETLIAVKAEIESAYSDEGYSEVDRRVWSGSAPDTALDPWTLLQVIDDVHSEFEDKDSPIEVVFIGSSFFATEDGATNPYEAALDLAKRATQRITGDSFSVSGQSVYEVRHALTEPASQTGPEQVDLFGFTTQYEVHLE